jgi:CRP-like cAMP-binding protein
MTVTKNIERSEMQNKLLAALPHAEFDKIAGSLKYVELEKGEVLWEMDEPRKSLYFPTTAMICLLYETEDGASIQVGMTGRRGMVGIVTFMGDAIMAKRAVVQIAGGAYLMRANDVERHFAESVPFNDICLSYTQALIAQISQSVVCNQLHSIEQQLIRYLLVNSDNRRSNRFDLTHASIAEVLGVRRESVSVAARQLKDRGLIDYGRGKIEILDRKSLVATGCECFQVERDQYKRILSKYIAEHDD